MFLKKYKPDVKSGGGVPNVNDDVKKDVKNYVLIKKGKGKFFTVYDTDALIINFLFGYKILPGLKCGFPDNSLSKVLIKLEDFKISYKVIILDKLVKEKNYKNINDYTKLSIISKKTADANNRLDLLIKNIKSADQATLERIIEYIEQCLKLSMINLI